jgi:hypothetical protein
LVTVTWPPQLSDTVGVPNTGRTPHATVTLDGQLMLGGVVSTVQVTVRETGVALLPQASVAFQVLV